MTREIETLLAERDLRFYDDRRIAFKGNRNAGEMIRDFNEREPLVDEAGAAVLADVIRDYVVPNASGAELYRVVEGLRDCPRKGTR